MQSITADGDAEKRYQSIFLKGESQPASSLLVSLKVQRAPDAPAISLHRRRAPGTQAGICT